jgi:hypothetical protein
VRPDHTRELSLDRSKPEASVNPTVAEQIVSQRKPCSVIKDQITRVSSVKGAHLRTCHVRDRRNLWAVRAIEERTIAEDRGEPTKPCLLLRIDGLKVCSVIILDAKSESDPACVKTSLNDAILFRIAGGFDDALCRWR